MTVDAVIFDWGGTLTPWHEVDFDRIWRSYASAYDSLTGAELDDLVRRLWQSEERVWKRGKEEHVSGTIDQVVSGAGLDPGGDAHERALRAYFRAWEGHTFTDPAVSELFAGLRSDGVRVGVLSNTLWPRETHHGWFERDGVADLIDGAVYSSELAWVKPHEEAFRAAMRAVGVEDPSRCVYVGDRLFEDVYGPQSLGMRAVHVPHSNIPEHQRGHTEGKPDAVIHGLDELHAIVRGWRAAPDHRTG